MTPAVLVAGTIVKSIMFPIQPIVCPIMPARTIIPILSRPLAIPAAIAGIMTIHKLGTLTVALVAVATLALVALISESGPR